MSEPAIRLENVGKMYKLFSSRTDNLLDALGLARVLPRRRVAYRELWALREIDLVLPRGERLGVIGRNGAGKTTLLKLITGNVAPTEGRIEVNGNVQALLESGGGLHPDFTGRENIRAALTYQGLAFDQIAAAEEDIAEFTELDDFLDQPFKTYSLGMQARLAFAISTTVEPEILIVDEVLGAGDAYFFGKSLSRMSALVESGASVLIVSHALDQVLRFCRNALWIDRGRIVKRGPSLEVVKAYEEFIRELEDRRLSAKNRKVRSGAYTQSQWDTYADRLLVRVVVQGDAGASCDFAHVRLVRDDRVEDEIAVGGPQDVDAQQSASVVTDDVWSPPQQEDGRSFRRLAVGAAGSVSGDFVFNLFAFVPEAIYTVEFLYRRQSGASADVELYRGSQRLAADSLSAGEREWTFERVEVFGGAEPELVGAAAVASRDGARTNDPPAGVRTRRKPLAAASRAWSGEGGLTIEHVELHGADGRERTVFDTGSAFSLRLTFTAHATDVYEVIPAAVLYRLDGVLVSRFIGEGLVLELEAGERRALRLDLGALAIGNGNYVFAVALYHTLDLTGVEAPELYDLVDRSYEFQIVGVPALATGVFLHPGTWSCE